MTSIQSVLKAIFPQRLFLSQSFLAWVFDQSQLVLGFWLVLEDRSNVPVNTLSTGTCSKLIDYALLGANS